MSVGFWRIRRIQEKKESHSHALQLMNEMIESESSYKYNNNGQKPEHLEPQDSQRVPPPPTPPSTNDQQVVDLNPETNGGRSLSTDQPQYQNEEQKDKSENGSVKMDTQVLVRRETPILVAAKMGILEMVQKILDKFPVAIQDMDSSGKNVLMLAAENRQTTVFDYLVEKKFPEFLFHQLDDQGNSILHLAAVLEEVLPWRIPGAALQMQWEIKWYKHVKHSVPPLSFAHNNTKGETPRKIFKQTHQTLVKDGTDWLIKTSESCSVVAALIATVAFASSATVPGGLREDTGHPVLENHPAFHVFSITSLVALTLAVTALVFFLSIITSRCQERDFKLTLPRMLLLGLTSLFASILAMLISFCAGHTFILIEKLRFAAIPIYGVACIPVAFFALIQLPLYFDLVWATLTKVPLRSYKVFNH
ncbi:Ankyrin repeat family protein [Abeliophyllum distichum]|uniref:Ankyrin repeat family protein n=1 Tax=Abeliophyllum distichum TaxID=126358 RepID=A0ABD1PZY8_9LAMI